MKSAFVLLCLGVQFVSAQATNESVQATQERFQKLDEQVRVERQKQFDSAQARAFEREVRLSPDKGIGYFSAIYVRYYGLPYYHARGTNWYNTNLLYPGIGDHLLRLEKDLPGISTNYTAEQRALTNTETTHAGKWTSFNESQIIWTDGVCFAMRGLPDADEQVGYKRTDSELAQKLVGYWRSDPTTNGAGWTSSYDVDMRADGSWHWLCIFRNTEGKEAIVDELGDWRVETNDLCMRFTNSAVRKVGLEGRKHLLAIGPITVLFQDNDDGERFGWGRRHGEVFDQATNSVSSPVNPTNTAATH